MISNPNIKHIKNDTMAKEQGALTRFKVYWDTSDEVHSILIKLCPNCLFDVFRLNSQWHISLFVIGMAKGRGLRLRHLILLWISFSAKSQWWRFKSNFSEPLIFMLFLLLFVVINALLCHTKLSELRFRFIYSQWYCWAISINGEMAI